MSKLLNKILKPRLKATRLAGSAMKTAHGKAMFARLFLLTLYSDRKLMHDFSDTDIKKRSLV